MTLKKYLGIWAMSIFINVSWATNFTVDNNMDSGMGSLREAVADAIADGSATPAMPHIINFNLPSPTTITLTGARITIDATHIHFVGNGIDMLIVDGNLNDRIFEIINGSTITMDGMTLQNGFAPTLSGGALTVETDCTLTLNRIRFVDNIGENGGAIRAGNNSMLTVNECIFESNTALGNGGAINSGGDADQITVINNSEFRGNIASDAGMTVGRGGAIAITDGSLEINNSVISGNGSVRSGSGIFIGGGSAACRIINCTLSGNVSGSGGAINNNGDLTIGNTIVALNLSYVIEVDVDNDPTISLGGNFIGNHTGAETSFPPGLPNGNGDYVGTEASPIDPFFISDVPSSLTSVSTEGDLRLFPGAPPVDKGMNAHVPPDLTDLDGNERIRNGRVDIGAYESAPAVPTLSQWGLILLGLILVAIGSVASRNIRKWETDHSARPQLPVS